MFRFFCGIVSMGFFSFDYFWFDNEKILDFCQKTFCRVVRSAFHILEHRFEEQRWGFFFLFRTFSGESSYFWRKSSIRFVKYLGFASECLFVCWDTLSFQWSTSKVDIWDGANLRLFGDYFLTTYRAAVLGLVEQRECFFIFFLWCFKRN